MFDTNPWTLHKRCRSCARASTYAQLNAFHIVENFAPYDKLIRYGTLEDIDNAIRAGKISPYGVDRGSRNHCFYVRFLLFRECVRF